jgi:hypothetical protein
VNAAAADGTHWRKALAGGAIALATGAAALGLAAAQGAAPGLSWSDEITYAAVGRHIADGRGPISSFAHPDAVLARGFPVRDVHMPAHAYALALVFRVFGPTETAAVAVGRAAFLLAGVLVFCTGRRLFGTAAGVWAAALFFFFPGLAVYGHSAMSEPTLLLLTAAWWLVWCEGLKSGRPAAAAALGLLLAVAATHRETSLALAPAGVFALVRWPPPHRRRAALVASVCFGVWMAAVFWPLYRARAPYPHALSFLLDATAQAGTMGAIAETLGRNVRPWSRPDVWLWVYALEWACAAAAVVRARRIAEPARALGRWGAATLALTFAALAPLYWIRGWTAVRMFLFTLPPCLVLLAGGAPARTRLRRHAVPAVALVVFVLVGLTANRWLARDRQAEAERGRTYAAFIRAHTDIAPPRLVIAAGAHRYGWEEYPVAVVDPDVDASHLAALGRLVVVDAIVSRRDRPHFLATLREHGYTRRSERPFEGNHVYVRERRGEPDGPASLDRPPSAR